MFKKLSFAFRMTAPLCTTAAALALTFQASAAEAQEPTHAHTAVEQSLSIVSPSSGSVNCMVYDFFGNSGHSTPVLTGAVNNHTIPVRQYPTTEWAYESWNGVFIWDFTVGTWTGAFYSIQQPLPALPTKPAVGPLGTPTNFTFVFDAANNEWDLSWTDNATAEMGYTLGRRLAGSNDGWTYVFDFLGVDITSGSMNANDVTSGEPIAIGDQYEYCILAWNTSQTPFAFSDPSNIVNP